MSELDGRAAFVTGGGSGIGRATSIGLAGRGAHVWVADFDEARAAETVDLVTEDGGRATAVRLDVRVEADWVEGLAQTEQSDAPLTILVNCAGKSVIADTFTMPLDEFKTVMAINVDGTFLGMKHVIPRIAAAGGGAVVNISSIAGLRGGSRSTAYCGSKAAIRMMTKAVALECAELGQNVRVNSVHPGVVDTPAWRKHSPDEMRLLGAAAEGAESLDPHTVAKTMVPLGVAAAPSEIADLIAFLASDSARHITGAEFVIDGGMTAG